VKLWNTVPTDSIVYLYVPHCVAIRFTEGIMQMMWCHKHTHKIRPDRSLHWTIVPYAKKCTQTNDWMLKFFIQGVFTQNVWKTTFAWLAITAAMIIRKCTQTYLPKSRIYRKIVLMFVNQAHSLMSLICIERKDIADKRMTLTSFKWAGCSVSWICYLTMMMTYNLKT